jgi:hypothetical protein
VGVHYTDKVLGSTLLGLLVGGWLAAFIGLLSGRREEGLSIDLEPNARVSVALDPPAIRKGLDDG